MPSSTDVITHFGVKGMKWGVSRSGKSAQAYETVTVQDRSPKGKTLKTSGGRNHGSSGDAVRAATNRQIAKKSSVDALSTKDLQDLVQRMNLERQYNSLKNERANPAVKFVAGLLGSAGKQQAQQAVNTKAASAVSDFMKKQR